MNDWRIELKKCLERNPEAAMLVELLINEVVIWRTTAGESPQIENKYSKRLEELIKQYRNG